MWVKQCYATERVTRMRTSPITDELAADAYVYAYSMDEAYRFLYETTIKPGIPFNEFQMIRDLADDTYTAHPTINNDTLHLQGWFDVAVEPVVVTVPDFDEAGTGSCTRWTSGTTPPP